MIVQTDDGLLWDLQQNHIDKAVAELYRRFHSMVTGVIIGMGASADDAEDVFQDTVLNFINAVRADKFKGQSSVQTFMVAIGRNLWMNEMRSRKRRTERNLTYSSAELATEVSPPLGKPLHSNAIENLFEQIGDVCKTILVGFYFEKKPMRVLLEETGFQNEQSLRNKKVKCLKQVKDLLATNPTLTDELKSLLYHE